MASRVECKVVVVGDAKIGKSALIRRLTHDEFLETYTPTGFDKVKTVQEVNKRNVEFVLWDTSGSPAYDSVRSLSYQEADVFLVCFKVSDPISLHNVRNKWSSELRHHRPGVPVVLCGCQVDLRSDHDVIGQLSKVGRAPVSQEQALAICCEIEAVNYVETSARSPNDSRDIAEAFELCALAAIKGCGGGGGGADVGRLGSFGATNVSFGSQASDLCGSAKRSFASANSSLKKSISGSESEICFGGANKGLSSSATPVILEDDVFPGFIGRVSEPPPLSPRFGRMMQRSSVGGGGGGGGAVVKMRNESALVGMVGKSHRTSVLLEPAPIEQQQQQQQGNFRVRPQVLPSRRASFRNATTRQQQPLPQPSQFCDDGNSYDFQQQQQKHLNSSTSGTVIQVFDLKSASCVASSPTITSSFPAVKLVGFESLKSHVSTGSQGSTGSKTSTGSSSCGIGGGGGLAVSSKAPRPVILGSIMDPDLPDTDDPQLLSQLQFVSPKAGVFRPVPSSNGGRRTNGGKKKHGCSIM